MLKSKGFNSFGYCLLPHFDLKGDAMTDLTLDEYYGIPEEKLGQILQAEARKILNSDSLENEEEVVNNLYLPLQQKHKKTALIFRYWKIIKIFISLPIQVFQKHF